MLVVISPAETTISISATRGLVTSRTPYASGGAGLSCLGSMQPGHTATYIAGIFGATVPNGTAVSITGDGHLGTSTSSARFKTNIQEMNNASEALFALRPVTFHYKKEIDPAGKLQMGLVAEDVEKVNPDLVVRDKEGMPYTVRYDQVNAMLLNEFIKEHRKVEELQTTVAQLMAHLKKQDSKIEKISNELEMSRPGSHVVANR